MISLLVAAVFTSATASPLPIIITTQSSPMCQTLREKIAPAIARIAGEDRVMVQQYPLKRGAPIYDLALNWIEIDKLLNPDTFFQSNDAAEKARMESLRERLQKVADDENRALNVLSGAALTYEMEALASNGGGGGMNSALGKQLTNSADAFGLTDKYGTPDIVNHNDPLKSGSLEEEYVKREAQTQQAELTIYPELQPLITQCSAPTPSPSAAPQQ